MGIGQDKLGLVFADLAVEAVELRLGLARPGVGVGLQGCHIPKRGWQLAVFPQVAQHIVGIIGLRTPEPVDLAHRDILFLAKQLQHGDAAAAVGPRLPFRRQLLAALGQGGCHRRVGFFAEFAVNLA